MDAWWVVLVLLGLLGLFALFAPSARSGHCRRCDRCAAAGSLGLQDCAAPRAGADHFAGLIEELAQVRNGNTAISSEVKRLAGAAAEFSLAAKGAAAPRAIKSYDNVVRVLEEEQGDWYVRLVVENELRRLFNYYSRDRKKASSSALERTATEDKYSDGALSSEPDSGSGPGSGLGSGPDSGSGSGSGSDSDSGSGDTSADGSDTDSFNAEDPAAGVRVRLPGERRDGSPPLRWKTKLLNVIKKRRARDAVSGIVARTEGRQ
jgi:hypothetical protein